MGVPDRSVRASDADRERVAQELSRQAAAGRLTAEELDERLNAAYAARTEGELAQLTDDLPSAAAAAAAHELEVRRARFLHRAGAAAITIVVCVGVWLATGANGSFWPIWVILGVGVGLANEGWRTLGPGAQLTDEQLARHDRHRRRRLG